MHRACPTSALQFNTWMIRCQQGKARKETQLAVRTTALFSSQQALAASELNDLLPPQRRNSAADHPPGQGTPRLPVTTRLCQAFQVEPKSDGTLGAPENGEGRLPTSLRLSDAVACRWR